MCHHCLDNDQHEILQNVQMSSREEVCTSSKNEFFAACSSPASPSASRVLCSQWPACSNTPPTHGQFPVCAMTRLNVSITIHVKDQGRPLEPAHKDHRIFLIPHLGGGWLYCVAMVADVTAAVSLNINVLVFPHCCVLLLLLLLIN